MRDRGMIRRLAGAALAAIIPIMSPILGAAMASSPDSWQELGQKSEAACLKAAKLRQAKAQAAIPFEGAVLRIVTGRYPQPHMQNAAATLYCLYDKRSGKAEISEPNAP